MFRELIGAHTQSAIETVSLHMEQAYLNKPHCSERINKNRAIFVIRRLRFRWQLQVTGQIKKIIRHIKTAPKIAKQHKNKSCKNCR